MVSMQFTKTTQELNSLWPVPNSTTDIFFLETFRSGLKRYNSKSSLNGICQEEALGSIYLLILLLNVFGDFLQNLTERNSSFFVFVFLTNFIGFPFKYQPNFQIFRQWDQFSKQVMDIPMEGYSSDSLAHTCCIQHTAQHNGLFKSQISSMQCLIEMNTKA